MENSATFEEKPRELGKSGIFIKAPLGIGTWSWGDSNVWGYGGYDPSFNDETIDAAFKKSLDSGLDFYDTAEVYGGGKSELILGNLMKKYKPVVVATKFAPMPWKIFQSSLTNALKESLKRLQMDKVDLYQIHSPQVSLRSVETWGEALADAHKQGLLKAVGVSNFNAEQVRRIHAALSKHGIPLASNQIEYSLLRTNAEHNGLLATCKELGVDILAYSPLGMGKLSGKYSKDNQPKGSRNFANQPWEKIDLIVGKLREIGEKHKKTPSQVALNWVICKGAIPLIGVKNPKQLEENLGCLGWRLSDDEVKELDKVSLKVENPGSFGVKLWQE